MYQHCLLSRLLAFWAWLSRFDTPSDEWGSYNWHNTPYSGIQSSHSTGSVCWLPVNLSPWQLEIQIARNLLVALSIRDEDCIWKLNLLVSIICNFLCSIYNRHLLCAVVNEYNLMYLEHIKRQLNMTTYSKTSHSNHLYTLSLYQSAFRIIKIKNKIPFL